MSTETGVVSRLLKASFQRPGLTLVLTLALSAFGAVALSELRRDVFPDLSAPVFNVIVQNAAMGAEELETGVAIPLEAALAGLPDVRRIRSTSQLGVAQVTVEFEPDADYYRCRQFVAERVAAAAPELPPGTDAAAPVEPHRPAQRDLRVHARGGAGRGGPDDAARPGRVRGEEPAARGAGRGRRRAAGRLPAPVPGADRSGAMAARGVTLDEVVHALEGANVNAAGGFVVQGPMEWTVRAVGRADSRRGPAAAPSWRCAGARPCCSATWRTCARRRRCAGASPTGSTARW